MQYSFQALHVRSSLARSLLTSLSVRPSVRPSCCQVMPPLCPISLPPSLPSFISRETRLHAHFLSVCNVGDSQPKQKQPTLLRPLPPSLPPSLPPFSTSSSSCACAQREEEERRRRSTIIHPRPRPTLPTDRPTNGKTSATHTHDVGNAHPHRVLSLVAARARPYLTYLLGSSKQSGRENAISNSKGATGLLGRRDTFSNDSQFLT